MVGVIANPASGRDIRRLVAGASVFGNADKAGMVLRLLAGLGAAGVERVLMMPAGDGGETWEPAAGGIDVPMPDMVELFVAGPDGAIWAIGSRGRLLRAEPDDWTWSSPLPPGAGVAVKSVAFG